jgi:colanic acid/amylovoran biosynthesis glycosyltransferase
MNTISVFAKTILPLSQTFVRDHILGIRDFSVEVLTCRNSDPSRILPKSAVQLNGNRTEVLLGALTGRVNKDAAEVLDRSSLVHAHFLTDAAFAYLPTSRRKIPLVVTAHGFDATAYRGARLREKAGIISEIWRESIIDYATSIICPSNYIADCLEFESNVPRSKLNVVHNGVADRFFNHPISETTPNCLFVGRLVEKKGCHHLLKAWEVVHRQNPDALLHIIGTGPDEKALKEAARPLGGSVIFHGAKPHEFVEAMIVDARVVAVPSSRARTGDNEGLPIICLETMATGKPLVCFHQGPLLETIEDGVSGLFANEGDALDLADKISFFLSSQDASYQYGKFARERALAMFTLNAQMENIEAIYKRILSIEA